MGAATGSPMAARFVLGLVACLLTLHSSTALPTTFNATALNATMVTGSSCDEGDQCWDFRLQNVQGCTTGWGIHGLWPQWQESCSQTPFDKSQVADIMDDLNTHWPSCQGSAEQFWDHEWKKHGTCSGMSQHAYFQKALSLLTQYSSQCDNVNDQSCNVCFAKDLASTEQCNHR